MNESEPPATKIKTKRSMAATVISLPIFSVVWYITKETVVYLQTPSSTQIYAAMQQLLTCRRGRWSREAWDRQAFEGEADCVDSAD
jgi:hypothetical protein